MNFYWQKYNDNNWVMPARMPDGKTYVSMTDSPQMLVFDVDTLEQQGMLHWEDKLNCIMGTTHVKNLPNGDLVGLCSEISMNMSEKGQKYLTAYRIKGDNIHMKELIGRIPTNGLNYQHSFAMSEDYITVFEHPINLNLEE